MGYELKVKNEKGEVLNLSTSKNYTVYKIAGLNPPKATLNMSVNATTDGSTLYSTRLETRNIVIYVAMERDIEASRLNLYKYFPIKKTVTLYFKNGKRSVMIQGTVELIECDLFTKRQVAQISIICPRPYFKDVNALVTAFSDINSLFQFPFAITENGVEFSTITANQRKSIINNGDIDTGVIIDIFANGTVVNPVIYNVFTGTHILLNFTMLPSDEIVIDTNIGEKSITLIRNGVRTNALGYMSPDSDWFVLTAGDNLFTYNADNGISNLQIMFTNSVLYGGV